MSYTITPRETDASRDPFTGAPDAHPVRTAIGAALGGAAAGAATGTVAGPVGTLIGAVVGAIVGGLTVAYRPYIERGSGFDDYYGPAYCYGDKAYTQYPGHRVEEVGSDLSQGWSSVRGNPDTDFQLGDSDGSFQASGPICPR